MHQSESLYCGEREAAALIGITVFALRKWRQSGVGPAYIRLRGNRGRILYPRADLVAFVENYRVETSESKKRRGER